MKAKSERRVSQKTEESGDHAGGVPPVPIPNTEVKTSRAKDTWGIAPGKVGHRQVNKQEGLSIWQSFLCYRPLQNAKSNFVV